MTEPEIIAAIKKNHDVRVGLMAMQDKGNNLVKSNVAGGSEVEHGVAFWTSGIRSPAIQAF